jgi:hypothetical protein
MLQRFFSGSARAADLSSLPEYDRLGSTLRPDRTVPPAAPADLDRCQVRLGSALPAPLRTFLTTANGGSFGGGLFHVLGAGCPLRHDDLATWNQPYDWKSAYPGFGLEQYVFFADDIFGNQFGYLPGEADPAVQRFDIQLGEWVEVAPSISEFLGGRLAAEGPWLLGADYVQEYRNSGRSTVAGMNLGLVIPLLLGGSLAPDNLRPVEPSVNLYVAGQVVTRIKPLPPGTEVRGFRVDGRSVRFSM